MERPKRSRPASAEPVAIFPEQLRIGDRFTNADGEWEVNLAVRTVLTKWSASAVNIGERILKITRSAPLTSSLSGDRSPLGLLGPRDLPAFESLGMPGNRTGAPYATVFRQGRPFPTKANSSRDGDAKPRDWRKPEPNGASGSTRPQSVTRPCRVTQVTGQGHPPHRFRT